MAAVGTLPPKKKMVEWNWAEYNSQCGAFLCDEGKSQGDITGTARARKEGEVIEALAP